MKRRILIPLLAALCIGCPTAMAQSSLQDWGIDPGVLAASGSDLLRRAPDGEVDALFQAVHAAARRDDEAQAMCALFEPDADRSLDGLNAAAARLGPASRERFATAIANALVVAMQSPPQAFDAAAARQSLKSAGVTAAILHEGFVGGLNAIGTDPAARGARCQSLRWLLDAMQSRPPAERAATTRLLLDEGLARLASDA
jgi:hypothetical protein